MYYPTIGEWVRVCGRRDEHLIVSADYTQRVAEISLRADGTTINERMPFSLLLKATSFEAAQDRAYLVANLAAASKRVLHASREHILRGRRLIADSQNSIFKTSAIIRASQRLIHHSDLVIARAQTLDCT